MTLKLTPTRLSLNGAVTLNVNLLVESFNKELYRNQLWYYSTPTIEKKVVNERRREPDNTPPVISSYIGQMVNVCFIPLEHLLYFNLNANAALILLL